MNWSKLFGHLAGRLYLSLLLIFLDLAVRIIINVQFFAAISQIALKSRCCSYGRFSNPRTLPRPKNKVDVRRSLRFRFFTPSHLKPEVSIASKTLQLKLK